MSNTANNNSTNSLVFPSYFDKANATVYTPAKQAKLAAALVKTQLEMGDATKGAKNPFFKSSYADLNSIREAVLPAANKNGIVVLQPTVSVNGKNYVRTHVIHESGEEMYADTEIFCVKPNDPQAHGSGISYARRYGLQAFFNVGAVDDDGEAAQGRTSKPAPAAKAAPAVAKAADAPAAPVAAVATPVTEAAATPTKSTSFRAKKSEAAKPAETAQPMALGMDNPADEDWS